MTLTNRWLQFLPAFTKMVVCLIGFALSATMLVKVTQDKLDTLREVSGADNKFVTVAEREKQLACLARNIYHEAGYESFEGKVAVAQVTLNRSESGQFPSDICEVIYQKNKVYEKVICQFSWYCQAPSSLPPVNRAAYNESMEVAKKVLLEGFRLPSLKNALYYHADYVNPGWGKEKVAKIGAHIFYSNRKDKNAQL